MQINYEFIDGNDRGGEITFTVSKFNNPIIDDMTGFHIETLDDEDYSVGETKQDITISGVNVATSFTSYDFNYVGTNCSGQFSEHQIILQSSIPVRQNCRFKIEFPPDFKVTSNLTDVSGSGFFEPIGSGLLFIPDEKENSVTIVACKKNYGYFTSGIVQFKNIQN